MFDGGRLIGFGAASDDGPRYDYLRFNVTTTIWGSGAAFWELEYSEDGGSTWVPASAMTNSNAPSPLVASASGDSGAGYEAWRAFDNGTANAWIYNSAPPQWVQIFFGTGNGINPNRVRYTVFNNGLDRSPIAFTVTGSNTGSFAGEEVTLCSKSGLSGNADLTVVTHNIP